MASNALENLSADKHELLSLALKKAGLARQDRITASTRPALRPLSFAQQRIWFLDQLEPGNPQYNTPTGACLEGTLDVALLRRTLEEIVRRHDTLRTVFPTLDGRPVQKVMPPNELTVPVIDLSELPEPRRTIRAREIADFEGSQPFDLLNGPLFRTVLLRLAADEHWLLVMTHHLVFDGWSVGVFADELATLYNAFADGKPSPLKPLPIQYADFAVWQRERLQGQFLHEQIEYWKKTLEGAPEILRMPTDHPRPPVQRFRGRIQDVSITASLTKSLNDLARTEQTTLFVILMAAFQALLHRYSGQDDLVVSAGTANRNRTEVASLIGCFINILLLRTNLSGNPRFSDLVRRVHESALEAHAHQDLPFDRLVSVVRPRRDLSYNPLAQVMMVLHNAPMPALDFHGLRLSRIPTPEKLSAQYDLLIHFTETENGIVGRLEYNTDLFESATIDRLLRNFKVLLQAAVEHPTQRISDLQILTQEEHVEVVTNNNVTEREFPSQCLHEQFERQVACNPEACAVIAGDEKLTYYELNARANRLASRLQASGVGPEATVGVCMSRSPELVIALLGVLKAGGAYMPMDPDYPSERLRFMIEDSRVKVVVTTRELVSCLPRHDVKVIIVEPEWKSVQDGVTENVHSLVCPDNLAYVIYTSGSTGVPKAVMLDHRGRVNNFADFNQRFRICSGDRVLSLSSPSFDMCAYDVFGTLGAGATIVLPDKSSERDPTHWLEVMLKHNVTIWHSVPALLELLLARLDCRPSASVSTLALRVVLLGGDWIPVALPERVRRVAPNAEVISLGGATEVSMDSTIYRIDTVDPAWTSIPYGQAMANQLAYVLDKQLQAVPIGVYGELYLGGVGVARGYHGRPDLTAEKFVPNPFSTSPGDRIYKTGDFARYKADGNLELLGRVDQQVKIHGLRVELGEIKTALERHPAVKQAEVLVTGNSSESKRLVSFILPRGAVPSISDVQTFLRTMLPMYMVPNTCIVLDTIPLSPNGKVDRCALAMIANDAPPKTQDHAMPSSELEQEIHRLWVKVLGGEQIGVDEDFFDLGGDSFQAIAMLQQLPYRLSLVNFLKCPTIRAAAQNCAPAQNPSSMLIPLAKHSKDVATLVCIPYGGGSAIVYQSLSRALSGKLNVYAAALPGHDIDGQQEFLPSIEAIAKQCVEEILQNIKTPIYLYGHCAGSALTIEIARLLEPHACLGGIFIGGSYPWFAGPLINALRKLKLIRRVESTRDVVDYIQTLGGIGDNFGAANLEFVANAFCHDRNLATEYFKRYALGWNSHRISAPLVCIIAQDDPVTVDYERASRKWELFAKQVELVVLTSGGHYFVKQKAKEVASIILAKCESSAFECIVEAHIA